MPFAPRSPSPNSRATRHAADATRSCPPVSSHLAREVRRRVRSTARIVYSDEAERHRRVAARRAAEWLANTVIGRLILGTGLAAIGTALAAGLAMISPRELQDQNWLIVTPIAFGLTEVAMGCRFLWCALTRTRTLAPEQTAWIAALFLTSIAAKCGRQDDVSRRGITVDRHGDMGDSDSELHGHSGDVENPASRTRSRFSCA
jgi:hypothetical protein